MKNAFLRFFGLSKTMFIIDGMACAFLAISVLGRTGSYWDALQSVGLFMTVWTLGYCSRALQSGEGKS